MKKLLFFIALILCGKVAFSQSTHTIDFSYKTLNANCNVFSSNVTVDTYVHQSTIGFPKFTGSPDFFVNLPCKRNSQSSQVGTEYQILFPFKKDHRYEINVYYKGTVGTTSDLYPVVALRLNQTAKTHNTSLTCNGAQAASFNYMSYFTAGSSWAWSPLMNTQLLAVDHQSLSVAGYPAEGTAASGNCAIQIRTVVIREYPPAATNPTFTLPGTVNITCGSTTPQQFTVTNVNNTPGVSSYNWDLGSGSSTNGWIYNGLPADQYIVTTTNSISLTPVCGTSQQGVKAVVTANGNTYSTNTAAINTTLPALSINGNGVIGNAENYSITGLPCNAAVSWSVSPGGLVSQNCTSCDQTTLTAVADGNVTLSATVTACGQTQTISKTITVCKSNAGVPSNLTATLYWPGSSYYGYYLYFTMVPGAYSYHMEWFDVTTNSLLNTYPIAASGASYYYFSAGHTYKYRLAAETSCGGRGAFSDWSGLLEPPPASCANGPIGSTLTQSLGCNGGSGCTYTNLNWPAISGAIQYRIEYSIANFGTGTALPTTTVFSAYPYTTINYSALNGTGWTVQYRVSVNCGSGWGNYSGWSARFFLQ